MVTMAKGFDARTRLAQTRLSSIGGLYITGGDFLTVIIFTTASTSGLNLSARVLTPDWEINLVSQSLDGVPTSTFTTKIFPIAEGLLLSLSVSNLNSGLADNTCFVEVGLQHSSNTGVPQHTIIVQGYVTNLFSLEWPTLSVRGGVVNPTRYTPVSATVANPAAGAEWTYTVGAGLSYQLETVRFQLVTSATVATRSARIRITDGTNELFKSDVNATQAASLTQQYYGGAGLAPFTASPTVFMVQIPVGMVLGGGWTVGSNSLNLQVADQYSGIFLSFTQLT